MMEVSPYDSNTENTAYFAAQTGCIPVRKSARQDPVFAAVLAEKPIKQLCFDNMDNGFQGPGTSGESMRWMPWANIWTWYLAGKRIWTAP